MNQHTEAIRRATDAVEAEMKRIGWWSDEAPAEPLEEVGAYDTTAESFPQWLQFSLIPRVRGLLETDGPWPEGSAVALKAVREFDSVPLASRLVDLLWRFDVLFGPIAAQPTAAEE